MKPFQNLSLKRKQTLIIMLTSGAALLLACLGFFTCELAAFRHEMVQNLSTLAQIVGNNSTAGLDFSDNRAVEETLAGLRAEPHIIGAAVYGKDGRVFATYDRPNDGREFLPPASPSAGWEFKGHALHLFGPIEHKGETIGTVYVQSDLNALTSRLRLYGLIGFGVLTVASLVAFALSTWLQRLISGPILNLVQTTRNITHAKNYSLRATKSSNDELGALAESFNEMLSQIQLRDAELEKSNTTLEQRVQERTRELAGSISLLNATLESTTDGVLVLNSEGEVTNLNAQFSRMWNIPDEVVAQGREAMVRFVLPLLKDPAAFIAIITQMRTNVESESFDLLEFKDGKIFERYSKPQRIGATCVGRVWSFRDITQRKQAEAVLRRTEELYRGAITGADAVPYAYDYKTRTYRFMGEEIVKLIGYTAQEMTPALWERIIQESIMLGETAGLSKQEAARRVVAGELRTWRCDMRVLTRDGKTRWLSDVSIQNLDPSGRPAGSMGILQDITERKQREEQMNQLNRQLVEVSRQAGMAEVATGVLHNVGNVLNSVNVTATLVEEQIRRSSIGDVIRLAGLFKAQNGSLGQFLTEDPKGKKIPEFIGQLAEKLGEEQATALRELGSLRSNIDHIKEIVAMQQSYAKISGVTETLQVKDLVEDTLRMNAAALVRHDIRVQRDYQDAPAITTDKHKVLQILVNLVRNAKYACDDSNRADKQITLGISHSNGGVSVIVRDNGIGIPPENLMRIFSHGFTTRRQGHGFGLHSGAIAARELGGSLTAHSDGPGKGATFTLELPCLSPTN